VVAWFAAAERSLAALERGEFLSPGTLLILQSDLQPWARGILWDTSDPKNCLFAQPSNRERLQAARGSTRQIDGAALRRMAVELDWDDLDICDQVDDGVEARTHCSLTSVLAFHHTGVAHHLEAARTVVESDMAEGWVSAAVPWLPRIPIRVLPRNVIITDKQRADPVTGELVNYQKLRISTDESESGSPDAPNPCIPKSETALDLCSAKDFGVGCAVVAPAFGGTSAIAGSLVDLESAFRFLLIQWLDLWLHTFLWWTPNRRAGVSVDWRVAFGGAFGPNRFQRVTLLLRAFITLRLTQFDLANPLPPSALAWCNMRQQEQAAGRLVQGAAQREPRYIQVFLDDFALAGGVDRVKVPAYLHHLRLAALGGVDPFTGGAFVPRDTRIHVYTLIALWCIQLLRLAASAPKTSCATRIICLGLRVAIDLEVIDCPAAKAEVMLLTITDLRPKILASAALDLRVIERLVGRLGYMVQIFAALRLWLAAGFALVRMRYRPRPRDGARRARRVAEVTLRQGGRRQRELLRLIDLAEVELRLNAGTPLAARLHFPAFGEPGSALIVTDASGVDGVGGYALSADAPRVVWLFSAWWPPKVRAALDMASRPLALREPDAARFAMPAAEAFGMFAVARALDAVTPLSSVTAVGDCLPAARAFRAASSASAQVRHILQEAHRVTTQWLPVHVPRELNIDPDRLSHPSQFEAVASEVEAAGFTAVELVLDVRGWDVLSGAVALPLVADEMDPNFT
jgi:hypothetical protein